MASNEKRPRSTRAAIIALIITAIGVAIAAFSAFQKSAEPEINPAANEPIAKDPINHSMAITGSDSTQFQVEHDINVDDNININNDQKLPDLIFTLSKTVYEANYDSISAEDPFDGDISVCPNSLVKIDSNINFDVPLELWQDESDNYSALGVLRKGSSISFNVSSDPDRYLIAPEAVNYNDKRVFFSFKVKKC